MSGLQFIKTLKHIGYPKADSLSPRGLDWMFEDVTMLPFLTWFCNTVGQQNVLSAEEEAEYEELKASQAILLEGEQLDDALRSYPVYDDDITQEKLKGDIERLKEDLDRSKKRKQHLVQTRNKLSLHHTGLTDRLSKLGNPEDEAKRHYKHALEACQKSSIERDASLSKLLNSVKHLYTLYAVSGIESQDSNADLGHLVFLSQNSLAAFHFAEEKFTVELTAFTKKQFFEGIANIAGGETSRYELLEVSDPTSLLVKGQSQEAFLQDCQELTRLQAVFPKSESERINAMVEAKCAASVCQQAEDILHNIQSGLPQICGRPQSYLQELNASHSVIKQELHHLTDTEVPSLVRELATFQSTTVLTGDYSLKLARQDYFTSNQNQVIEYLVQQRARNEFLTMAYEIEARGHRETHRLLTAIKQTLQAKLSSFDERMKIMADPYLTKARYERGTIDTRDMFSTRLYHMLVTPDKATSERQLFLPYSSMVSAAQSLMQQVKAARAEAVSTADMYQARVSRMEEEVQRCENVLYAESSTLGGQPQMMPVVFQKTAMELDEMLQKLEAAILDTITDINNKKKVLKKDALQMKERELFTLFHLHPDRLKTTVENLEQRLQVHSVS
ncbi:LOW QUALITY PROTEIN: HAUS augmin-like complex subunit 3 [Pomacea canaliculata]|uniref:LOW QUALITY PROTEIN: HAUS augmin-like complex subunit 3 n=1 Tax=Pomacea canaliculata TaxID=400727 RepID=UPI000D734EB1|nr:LOW QUALITY PROTEIN: HAUS augmin-like complex subunit 3 [Pomacea canaliculata]